MPDADKKLTAWQIILIAFIMAVVVVGAVWGWIKNFSGTNSAAGDKISLEIIKTIQTEDPTLSETMINAVAAGCNQLDDPAAMKELVKKSLANIKEGKVSKKSIDTPRTDTATRASLPPSKRSIAKMLDDVGSEIKANRDGIEARIDEVTASVSGVEASVDDLMTSMDSSIGTINGRLDGLEKSSTETKSELEEIKGQTKEILDLLTNS